MHGSCSQCCVLTDIMYNSHLNQAWSIPTEQVLRSCQVTRIVLPMMCMYPALVPFPYGTRFWYQFLLAVHPDCNEMFIHLWWAGSSAHSCVLMVTFTDIYFRFVIFSVIILSEINRLFCFCHFYYFFSCCKYSDTLFMNLSCTLFQIICICLIQLSENRCM